VLEEKKFRLKFMFQEIDLSPGTFVIGRSPSCNLTLEDPLASRQHAHIRVTDDDALLDDLGSRNGTLVNGEPVYEDHRLHHKDRIRIGSHDIVFLEVKRYPSRPMRATGALVTCAACRVPFPAGARQCPHCGTPISRATTCPKCSAPLPSGGDRCPSCGAAIDPEEVTVPVELGGASAGWTSALVDEVIRKALSAGKLEHAASLLQGKIEDIENKAESGSFDADRLAQVSELNLAVAEGRRDGARVMWTIDMWTRARASMPESVLDAIVGAAGGWLDVAPALSRYADAVSSQPGTDPGLVERLRGLLES